MCTVSQGQLILAIRTTQLLMQFRVQALACVFDGRQSQPEGWTLNYRPHVPPEPTTAFAFLVLR
jgi:hypothetical protein